MMERMYLYKMLLRLFLWILLLICFNATKGENSSVCSTCICETDEKFGGLKVQCSNIGLDAVPKHIPANATTLLLDENKLTTIPNGSFNLLTNLKHLDLSYNHLGTLVIKSFSGLENLRELHLESNNLSFVILSQQVFQPLSRLIVLRLNNNTKSTFEHSDSFYQYTSLGDLKSLETLFIDSLSQGFGPVFKKLPKLVNLTVSGTIGYCNLPMISNATFLNTPHLRMLNISNCLIHDVDYLSFSLMKNITELDVSLNRELGFTNLSKAFYGLRNFPLQVIRMNQIFPKYGSCSRLTNKHVTYLNSTPLRELHIDGNGIIEFEQGTLLNLPTTLELLSARDNRLSVGVYLFEFANMESLRYFDVSYINKWHSMRFGRSPAIPQFKFSFPPNLHTFILSHCYLGRTVASVNVGNTTLKKVVADHNLLTSLHGPISGFNDLEHADFSNNYVASIDSTFFQIAKKLNFLNLGSNNLGECFSKDENGEIFKSLSKIQHLDLHANRINKLPLPFFNGLESLQILNLSFNNIDQLNVDIGHLYNLSYLDLRGNKLRSLNTNIRNHLNKINNVTINLKGNTLSCRCQEFTFLMWMQKFYLNIEDLNTTMCLFENGKRIDMSNLNDIINKLTHQCKSNAMYLLSSLFLLVVILVSMGLAVVYRFRWRLRRLYYLGKRKQKHNIEEDEYVYDAFICYADDDRSFVKDVIIPELEDKAGLKLCVHHRDFIPGTVIASNVVNSIQNSRKTLVVLSPMFLKSEWCHYEFNMAETEGVARRENIIVAVMYKPVEVKHMHRDMARMFTQYSYLQYNMNGHDAEIFWQNVIDAVTTADNVDE